MVKTRPQLGKSGKYICLRFTCAGKRYTLSDNWEGNTRGLEKAHQVAARVETDILAENLDTTLNKDRSDKKGIQVKISS